MSPEFKAELTKLTKKVVGRLLWLDFCASKDFTDTIENMPIKK